ncbi:MAG: glycosyltransferase family 4 protein [Chloroflexaceae bacterium]
MRVALVRNFPEERWRSIEVYSDRLIAALRVLAPDVTFVEVRQSAWSWPDLRVPMPYGRAASLRTLGIYLSRWLRYPLTLRRINADVYHILDNSYGHLAFFTDPRRTIVTYHSGGSGPPQQLRRWHPAGPALMIFRLAFRGMLRAARIIAVSADARQELIEATGYPGDHISVVHHGIDPVFGPGTPEEREQQRRHFLQPGERYLVLHVGHGAARKNLEGLYRAFHQLRQREASVRLVRIGSMPTPAQQQLIMELGIAPAITHIAHVANQDLPHYYAAADLFVFPSLYEGFGIPLIEAMACGTPVVCSDTVLFREVGADAGYFVDTGSPEALAHSMQEVLTNPTLSQQMRMHGLERAHHFTWQRAAQETLAVYQGLYHQ